MSYLMVCVIVENWQKKITERKMSDKRDQIKSQFWTPTVGRWLFTDELEFVYRQKLTRHVLSALQTWGCSC